MSMEEHSWIDATVAAMRDCLPMFEADSLDVVSVSNGMPPQSCGAYISVAGSLHSAEMGVVGGRREQQILAQKFLGADSDLGDDDVADAMREVANVVAGGLKTLMIGHDPSLILGLPLYVDGLNPGPSPVVHCAQLRLLDISLALIVIARGARAGSR